MSLKGFHIVFITVSIMLAVGLGIWCVRLNVLLQTQSYLVGAILSFGAAVGLFFYGLWFYRKMKRLRIFS